LILLFWRAKASPSEALIFKTEYFLYSLTINPAASTKSRKWNSPEKGEKQFSMHFFADF